MGTSQSGQIVQVVQFQCGSFPHYLLFMILAVSERFQSTFTALAPIDETLLTGRVSSIYPFIHSAIDNIPQHSRTEQSSVQSQPTQIGPDLSRFFAVQSSFRAMTVRWIGHSTHSITKWR